MSESPTAEIVSQPNFCWGDPTFVGSLFFCREDLDIFRGGGRTTPPFSLPVAGGPWPGHSQTQARRPHSSTGCVLAPGTHRVAFTSPCVVWVMVPHHFLVASATRDMPHSVVGWNCNDPAAGSPTATLLRLLLPLAAGHCPISAGNARCPRGAGGPTS